MEVGDESPEVRTARCLGPHVQRRRRIRHVGGVRSRRQLRAVLEDAQGPRGTGHGEVNPLVGDGAGARAQPPRSGQPHVQRPGLDADTNRGGIRTNGEDARPTGGETGLVLEPLHREVTSSDCPVSASRKRDVLVRPVERDAATVHCRGLRDHPEDDQQCCDGCDKTFGPIHGPQGTCVPDPPLCNCVSDAQSLGDHAQFGVRLHHRHTHMA